MKYTFLGTEPMLYPMLTDYPAEGEAQNLEAEYGIEIEFIGAPPPGPWVESNSGVGKEVKAFKAALAKAESTETEKVAE